jgi:hypothetical protein
VGAFLFSVEPSAPGDMFLPVVESRPIPTKKPAPVKVTPANKVFWVRPANAELDRSGEWLLTKLTTTRASIATRAGPV